MANVNLFYVGQDFYLGSGTMMSSIYEVGSLKRYDWGLVQSALRYGNSVNLRPATKEEMDWARKQLEQYSK